MPIAGETVKHINNDNLKRAAGGVLYHFLKRGAVVVRSRARFIGVNPYNSITLTFGVLGANAYLPLNRLLVLSLRGIAGVDNCVFVHCLLLCAVVADCGLKILLFALVLTVLTGKKCRRRQIVKAAYSVLRR